MKVIKVVDVRGGKLISTFAPGGWQKKYARGIVTKPDIGYLFAYSRKKLREAKRDMNSSSYQFWLADAEVVGRVRDYDIGVAERCWSMFWKDFKPQPHRRESKYLLCSSITLIERIKGGK